MRYSKYTIFLKVVELGNFSKTADFYKYSQSAVTQIVKSLEAELQMTLLKRSHAGVCLTSDGEQILPYIRELAMAEEKMWEKAGEITGMDRGLIRIGVFSSIACHYLPGVMKEFRKLYPGIDFELHTGDYSKIEQWIAEGLVDFGFLIRPVRNDYDIIDIMTDEMLAVLPEKHPMTEKTEIPLKAFEDESVILLQEGGNQEIEEHFKKNKIAPHISYYSGDDYAVMSMVENELGIGILSELVMKRCDYHIVTRSLKPCLHREIVIAVKNEKNASVAVKKFLQFVPSGDGKSGFFSVPDGF